MRKKPYIMVVDDTRFNHEVLTIILADIDAELECVSLA